MANFKQTSAAEVVESNVPSPWATLCDQFESWRFGGLKGKKIMTNHDPLGCPRKFSDPWLCRVGDSSPFTQALSESGLVFTDIYRPQHKGGTLMS